MDQGQTENGTLTEQEPTGLLAGAGSEEMAGGDPNAGRWGSGLSGRKRSTSCTEMRGEMGFVCRRRWMGRK